MASTIVAIVEGFGEVDAVPLLIRRCFEGTGSVPPQIPRPIRIPKHRLLAEGELERAIEQAARRAGPNGAILVLLDADDECAKDVGRAILERAVRARPDRAIAAVLAVREFEAWFLASAEALSGCRGLQESIEPPDDPESVRDAKGWLSQKMTKGRRYAPRVDQPALAQAMDLTLAARSPSFRKFVRDIERLEEAIRSRTRGS